MDNSNMIFHWENKPSPFTYIYLNTIHPRTRNLFVSFKMDDFAWSSGTQDAVFDQFRRWGDEWLGDPSVFQVDGGEGSSHGGGNCGGYYGGDQVDGKVGSASKNHSEAEKRRRDRINAHLATLRKLVCNSDKMDKATLLGKVIEHLKEQKSTTMELSKVYKLPTDSDEVIVDFVTNTTEPSNNVFIKASICCEDRPELLSEINHTIKRLTLTMVQADMTCLGGRIKCNFILCVTNIASENEMTALKKSLRIIFERIVSSCSSTTSSNYRIKSKRQRFFCSANYNTNDC
ncbi:putative transcription factor bHLH family [Helianthus anomalus]